MTGTERKKVSRHKQAVKENQVKNLNYAKQKASAMKAKVKKDVHIPPNQDDKDAKKKKKRCKTVCPKKDVHNALDKSQQMEPQKGSLQQCTHHFTNCLKASERAKKLDLADKERLMRRQQSSITPKKVRNVVPLPLTLRNITLPLTCDENQATHRTISREQALVEMVQQSRLNTPYTTAHLQGLSALAPELPPRRSKSPEMTFKGKTSVVNAPAGEVETYCLKEDVTGVVVPEVTESTEPSMYRQVSLFEDWNHGSGSQKLHKPVRVDRVQRQRREIESQQDYRLAQKITMRKKELRYFRRLEGEGRNIDDIANTTSTPAGDLQSIANFPTREDVVETARGCAKFLYRPGAAWRNVSSDTTSFSSFGPNLNMLSEHSDSTRPTSCETKKSTTEIVVAICSANARRETMRKELVQRLGVKRVRKKRLLAQERASTRLQHLQCRCC